MSDDPVEGPAEPIEPRSGPGLPGVESDAFWYDYMTKGDPRERAFRRVLSRLPAAPRCKACAAPFSGPGGSVMRMVGKGPSDVNPNLCGACFSFMRKHRGGAEIELTLLFADVRGSTGLAESMTPTAFHSLMDRFYQVAARAVFAHDGGVDKFVGDEVMAMFFPLATGPEHSRLALEAASQLLRETGHEDPAGPWLPLGAGVHTGTAWVGALGDASRVELTALGDAVNVAARLASVARTGEIVVSSTTAARAGVEDDLDRSVIELKGRAEPIEIVRMTVASS